MANKVGIISQARMTSTRLPGKILLESNGKTMLEHHIGRLNKSGIPVYVATTVNTTDDPIIAFCESRQIQSFRGDEENVLERFYQCAVHYELDTIIRVTSDCPLIDGKIVADAVKKYLQWNEENVYYSNCLERTFPRGLDFEIFSFQSLDEAYRNATELFQKEHVTPYINRNESGKIILRHFKTAEDHSDLRWTLDTQEDYLLLNTMISEYKVENMDYAEIIQVVSKNPVLKTLNNFVKQKEI
jgi:spore coat polysaccharide biosynthesis protein SpsF